MKNAEQVSAMLMEDPAKSARSCSVKNTRYYAVHVNEPSVRITSLKNVVFAGDMSATIALRSVRFVEKRSVTIILSSAMFADQQFVHRVLRFPV